VDLERFNLLEGHHGFFWKILKIPFRSSLLLTEMDRRLGSNVRAVEHFGHFRSYLSIMSLGDTSSGFS
jgi:hypothetical protein